MKQADEKARDEAQASHPNVEWAQLACSQLIERLAARRPDTDRYTVVGEVGRGGMGRVLRVRDQDLHRDLAMKILRDDDPAPREADTVTPQMLISARFIEEAQVAAQLDHPGIVPVHDVGLDAEGRMYFTMKLVRGRTLEKVLELALSESEGWSTTRVLGVLLRVCEAMSYAHDRGVLHRDLKPSNIMIGHHGEVFVMDWGLARLIDRPRHEKQGESESGELYSARNSGSASGSSSPFVTEDGRIMGTPAFMSPEQARGDGGALGPASDVYAVGAMLYQALSGRAPYSQPGRRLENRFIWLKLQSSPPEPLMSLARKTPAELVAICEKAMARSVADRYVSMADLGDDLRAYLEVRAVSAHKTGPLTELKKWVSRNRATAALLLVLVLTVTTAGFVVAWRENLRLKEASLRAAAHRASSVRSETARSWHVDPASVPRINNWLARARAVLADAETRNLELGGFERDATSSGRGRFVAAPPEPQLEKQLANARQQLTLMRPELARLRELAAKPGLGAEQLEEAHSGLAVFPFEIDWLDARIAALERQRGPTRVLELDRDVDQEQYEALAGLVRDQKMLVAVDVPQAEADLIAAGALGDRSIAAETAAWEVAIASIADPAQCPAYAGLRMSPQMGLVPLRQDSQSGLWEFWHVPSGERPEERAGKWKIAEDTGIVLVLVPGGTVTIGAQKENEQNPRFDPDARPPELLRHARLDPYFIGKYEVTQGQWLRITSESPSFWFPGNLVDQGVRVSRANPVERLSWFDAAAGLRRVGLDLPTEFQWENAARGGTDLRFGAWDEYELARPHINLFTDSKARNVRQSRDVGEDGYFVHSTVDALDANAFGLFGTLGNVEEWCRDWYADECDNAGTARDGDGEIEPPVAIGKTARGAGFRTNKAAQVRVSFRAFFAPTEVTEIRGIRAARAVEP